MTPLFLLPQEKEMNFLKKPSSEYKRFTTPNKDLVVTRSKKETGHNSNAIEIREDLVKKLLTIEEQKHTNKENQKLEKPTHEGKKGHTRSISDTSIIVPVIK